MQRSDMRGAAAADTVERRQLVEDIRTAEQEWSLASFHFENARGEDEVDYAIYCLEAAEKKLDMLLRKAKLEWRRPEEAIESGAAG